MSNTPRTDEQINGKPCTRFAVCAADSLRDALVSSDFARQLDRELSQQAEFRTLLDGEVANLRAELANERELADRLAKSIHLAECDGNYTPNRQQSALAAWKEARK